MAFILKTKPVTLYVFFRKSSLLPIEEETGKIVKISVQWILPKLKKKDISKLEKFHFTIFFFFAFTFALEYIYFLH